MAYKILMLGVYGSLLASKISSVAHSMHLICLRPGL